MPDEQVVTDLVDQARNLSWLLAAEDGALTFPQFETPLLVVTGEDAALALGEAVEAVRPLVEQPLPVGRMRGCQYRAASGAGVVSVFTAAGRLAEASTQAPASPEPA